MHLGNGAITPECAALTASVAALGLGCAGASVRREILSGRKLVAAGVYGAAIFAAQMINVPVLPYSSGHLVGGVLLAIALGPSLGALTMAVVLALQAVLLGDGGAAALGANIINMALIPAAIVAWGNAWRREDSSLAANSLRAGVQAAAAVLIAAGLIVLEVALLRGPLSDIPLRAFAWQMLVAHVVIGLLEGLATGVLVYAVRGNFIPDQLPAWRTRMAVTGGLMVALLAAIPIASGMPDGYEASAERSGWHNLLAEAPEELVALGDINVLLASWQAQASEQVAAWLPSEILLALVTTLAAGLISAALAWACSAQRQPLKP